MHWPMNLCRPNAPLENALKTIIEERMKCTPCVLHDLCSEDGVEVR